MSNRIELYFALMIKSLWFWTNLLFVVLAEILISWGVFIAIPVAVIFNWFRDVRGIGPRDSIAEATAGYIWGTLIAFILYFILGRGLLG